MVAAVAAAVTVFVVTTRDPDRLPVVLAAIAGTATALGALVAAAFLSPGSRGRRGPGPGRSTPQALRRGAIAGSAVGLVAVLRVVDGLTPLTAAFVVGAFVLAEVVLSARTS